MTSVAVPDTDAQRPRETKHHAVIAGTGRAGTTFLVQFLAACGLDVGKGFDPANTHDLGPARAGLERYLIDPEAPYVVKDPWLWTYCDEVDLSAVAIDALILPTRDLITSATSRVYQERIELVASEWRTRPPVDVRSGALGGVVYSLDPIDQARLLAVGFHRVVHWATRHEIPLFLLDFPRTVNDSAYLISTLGPWLSQHCAEPAAREAFEAVARPESVRFGDTASSAGPRAARLSVEDLEIERRAMAAVLDQRDAQLHDEQEALARARADQRLAADQLLEVVARLEACEAQLALTTSDRDALQRTLSWRVTAPLRAVRRGLAKRISDDLGEQASS